MSWVLVVALIVIFVIRTGYAMMNRQRLRTQTGITNGPARTVAAPAQQPGGEPTQPAVPAPLWEPEHVAPAGLVPEQRRAVAPHAGPPAEPPEAPLPVAPVPDDVASDDTEVPTSLELTPDLQARVRELMHTGFEAGAVRLICDELGVGILEAQQTARAVARLPTP